MSSDIDRTLGFIQQFSDQAMSSASSMANRLAMATGTTKEVKFTYDPNKPVMDKLPSLSDLLADYETQDVNVTLLNDAAEEWIAKYLPNIAECLDTQPEQWACGILSGTREFGMNKAAFDAAWHVGRDRAYRQSSTEKAQIEALHSLRGFSLPSGSFASSMVSADIRASDAIAEINMQQAIKEAEVKLELIKLAATTATQVKTSLMGMLANFFGNIVSLSKHEPGAEKLKAKSQAYSSFISGLSNYFNVELGFEKLRLDAAKAKTDTEEVNAKMDAELSFKGIDSRNAGFAQAARGFADAAGAAANAASSLQAELYSGQV